MGLWPTEMVNRGSATGESKRAIKKNKSMRLPATPTRPLRIDSIMGSMIDGGMTTQSLLLLRRVEAIVADVAGSKICAKKNFRVRQSEKKFNKNFAHIFSVNSSFFIFTLFFGCENFSSLC
jgi:hypothetical protein